MTTDCVFCQIVAGTSPAKFVASTPDAITIHPLYPVTLGHMIVIPTKHVADFTTDPDVSALTMAEAARVAAIYGWPCNIITSRGREATQSVFHLHLHIVPRRENDGLALPWYSGKSRKTAPAAS